MESENKTNAPAQPTVGKEEKQLLISDYHLHITNYGASRPGYFHQPESARDEPYLIGSKCKLCGCVTFPALLVCPVCVKEDTMEETKLSRRGKVISYAVARLSIAGFPAPYIQAFIEIEDGPRVFSLITGCEAEEGVLDIGEEVELVVEKMTEDDEGNDIIGYKFKPLKV